MMHPIIALWTYARTISTGIRKNRTTYDVTVDNSDHLKRYYEHHLPFYGEMHRHRIRAAANWAPRHH